MGIELRNANIKTIQQAAMRLINGEIFVTPFGASVKFDSNNLYDPFRYIIDGGDYTLSGDWKHYTTWQSEIETEDEWPKLRMVRNNDQEPCKLAMVVSYENGLGFKTDDGKYYTQCSAPTKDILLKYL